jgi:hypothetical protein
MGTLFTTSAMPGGKRKPVNMIAKAIRKYAAKTFTTL